MPKRYAELFPQDLADAIDSSSTFIWPWGALEWHGDHLPLGVDGILADAFSERLAERIGGVLLPTCWLPITTLPHVSSLQVSTATMRGILDDTLSGLARAGVQSVAIVSGHYAQGHQIEHFEAALRAIDAHPDFRVFAAAPLEVLGDSFLDHAARFETSQMLAAVPRLVHLENLPSKTEPKTHAVLGEHPRLGSAEEGERLFTEALEAWETWLRCDSTSLRIHYESAILRYEPYKRAHFKESWEEAIESWWIDRTGGSKFRSDP